MPAANLASNVTTSGPTNGVGVNQYHVAIICMSHTGDATGVVEAAMNTGTWFPLPVDIVYSDEDQTIVRVSDTPVNALRINVTVTTGRLDASACFV